MKYKLLLGVLALASIKAYALEGVVVNDRGAPVAGAIVKGLSSAQTVVTDEQGRFFLQGDSNGFIDIQGILEGLNKLFQVIKYRCREFPFFHCYPCLFG